MHPLTTFFSTLKLHLQQQTPKMTFLGLEPRMSKERRLSSLSRLTIDVYDVEEGSPCYKEK